MIDPPNDSSLDPPIVTHILLNSCPAGNSPCRNQHCELRSVSASQVSTGLIVLVTMLVFSTRAVLECNKDDKFFAVQSGIALVVTTLFYLVGVWGIESKEFPKMRGLGGRCAFIEWLLRVVMLVVIGIAGTFIGGVSPFFELPAIAAGLVFIVLCSFMFLLWDAVVARGGLVTDAWRFYRVDVSGAIATLFCLGSYLHGNNTVGAFALIVLLVNAVYAGWFYREGLGDFVSYLGRADRRR